MTRAGESPRQESVWCGALHGVSSGGGCWLSLEGTKELWAVYKGRRVRTKYNKAGGASGGRSGARVKRGGVAPRELRGVCVCVRVRRCVRGVSSGSDLIERVR